MLYATCLSGGFFWKSATYRFSIARPAITATCSVAHCTLLHAGRFPATRFMTLPARRARIDFMNTVEIEKTLDGFIVRYMSGENIKIGHDEREVSTKHQLIAVLRREGVPETEISELWNSCTVTSKAPRVPTQSQVVPSAHCAAPATDARSGCGQKA